MQSALDLAESGFKVYLVEEAVPASGAGWRSSIRLSPPTTAPCAPCPPRWWTPAGTSTLKGSPIRKSANVTGEPGHFQVTVKKKARSVDPEQVHRLRRMHAQLPGEIQGLHRPVEVGGPHHTSRRAGKGGRSPQAVLLQEGAAAFGAAGRQCRVQLSAGRRSSTT